MTNSPETVRCTPNNAKVFHLFEMPKCGVSKIQWILSTVWLRGGGASHVDFYTAPQPIGRLIRIPAKSSKPPVKASLTHFFNQT